MKIAHKICVSLHKGIDLHVIVENFPLGIRVVEHTVQLSETHFIHTHYLQLSYKVRAREENIKGSLAGKPERLVKDIEGMQVATKGSSSI